MKDQFNLKLSGHDTRNPVILKWLNEQKDASQMVRDMLYRYIVGLLVPNAPRYSYSVIVNSMDTGMQRNWTFYATDEEAAGRQAIDFATLNHDMGRWIVTSVMQL